MNIRYRLSIQFTLIVLSILVVLTTNIYYFSSSYRENDYYSRLRDRANTTARLYLDVKEVDESLLKIIDKNTLALNQEKIFIFNPDDEQIYSNLEDSLFNNPEVIKEVRENQIIEFHEGLREAIGFVYNFENKPYVVIASAMDIYGIDKIKNLKIILFVSLLLGLIVTVFAGLLFAGKALSPIDSVVEQVKKITITNLNLRVDEGNKKDEIAKLAITFNQMLQRLEETFIQQRDFVSNAAHELRTPFTVLITEIDYCLMQERSKEQYINTLNNLSTELRNLSLLSNGLLDLARLSFDKSGFQMNIVRIDELLLETCNEVINKNKTYKPQLNFEQLPDDESFLEFYGSAQLLKIAVKNLIENACKFSEDKTVRIALSVNQNSIILKFTDRGIGIPKEDINNIFQPFYRGNNTQFIAGYGLGLALTLKIIHLHNGNINVESEVGKGSVFSLLLPNKSNSNDFLIRV